MSPSPELEFRILVIHLSSDVKSTMVPVAVHNTHYLLKYQIGIILSTIIYYYSNKIILLFHTLTIIFRYVPTKLNEFLGCSSKSHNKLSTFRHTPSSERKACVETSTTYY